GSGSKHHGADRNADKENEQCKENACAACRTELAFYLVFQFKFVFIQGFTLRRGGYTARAISMKTFAALQICKALHREQIYAYI
ncbi:MAG: hypothetical protein MJ193_05305, partial [Clostridia bacterium]|nr:hypothetical protein [Clostridia bacterium]